MKQKLLMRRFIESLLLFTIVVGFALQPVVRSQTIETDDGSDSNDDDSLCPRNREEAAARGRQCLRKCKTDADCISSRKRCLCDGQCGWSCVRPDLNCDELTSIENGQFKINGNYFGARVIYSCDEEFYLSGTRERVCQGDTSWSDQSPVCKKKAMCGIPLTVPHARHTAPIEEEEFDIDSTVEYSCFPGYDSKGFNTAKCLYYNSTAQWFGPDLKCIPKSCGHPGDVENGVRDGVAHTFTSRITYSCNDGFELVGRANRYCQSNGQWSGVLPSCRPVQCPIPEDPINGRALYSSVIFDSLVRYECRYGFKLHGNQNRTCTSSKQWEGEAPKCLEIDCGSPGVLHNGYLEVRRTILGSVIHFRCFDGMIFSGEHNTTTCLENGTWSNPLPNCLGFCTVPDIEHGRVSNLPSGERVTHSQVIKVDCKPQYELYYNKTDAICNNGTWSYGPRCVPARCKSLPERPKNGLVIAPKIDHGMKALYRCRDGFNLEGNNVTECHFGKWTLAMPKCVEVYCPFPGFIENGKVLLIGHIGMYDYRPYVKKVSNNKQILYECDRGYRIHNGDPMGSTCIDGQWSPKHLPTCVKGSHPNTKWLRSVRSVRNVNKFYYKKKNSLKAAQQNTKIDSMRVSRGRRHKKFKEPCRPLNDTLWMKISVVKFGMGNDAFPHRTLVRILCSKGYVSNIGNRTAKCAKGKWKPKEPKCLISPCLVPYAENGYFYNRGIRQPMAHSVSHGDTIKMECISGYHIEGAHTIRCWYGEWSGQQPKCTPSPCALPNIKNGFYAGGYRSGLTIAHGSVIEFHCEINYVKGVEVPPRCIEGSLMPEPPHCIERRLVTNIFTDKGIISDESKVVEEPKVHYLKRKTVNATDMLWCEPPEKLEHVLKYSNEENNLISVAQMNDEAPNTPNTNQSIETTTEYMSTLITSTLIDLVNSTVDNFVYNVTNYTITENSTDSVVDNRFHPHGTEIVFNCIPSMNGLRNTWKITCEDGGWVGRAFRCEDDNKTLEEFVNKSCVYTNTDPNVWAFFGDHKVNENEEFPPQTELTIRCKDIGKFNLIGSGTRKCVYGDWDGEKPSCFGLSQENDYALEKSPTILFRHQLGPIAQSNDGKLIVYPGTILHLECLWIKKFGTPVWECSHSCKKYNKDWTTESGRDKDLEYRLTIFHAQKEDSGLYTCKTPNFHRHSVEIVVKAVHCKPHAETEGLKISNPSNKMNAKVMFSCRSGLILNGSDEAVCLPSGNWSIQTPNCVSAECPDISNTNKNESLLTITMKGRSVGDITTFSCANGYNLKGKTEAYCLFGQWSSPVPICEEVRCAPPPTPSHGYLQGYVVPNFRGGDIVQFTCDPGFMLEGNPIIICQENSRWSSPPPNCVPACAYPGTMNGRTVSIVKYFYNVNETISFDCADGYEIKGQNMLKCLQSGRWSATVPECQQLHRG